MLIPLVVVPNPVEYDRHGHLHSQHCTEDIDWQYFHMWFVGPDNILFVLQTRIDDCEYRTI